MDAASEVIAEFYNSDPERATNKRIVYGKMIFTTGLDKISDNEYIERIISVRVKLPDEKAY